MSEINPKIFLPPEGGVEPAKYEYSAPKGKAESKEGLAVRQPHTKQELSKMSMMELRALCSSLEREFEESKRKKKQLIGRIMNLEKVLR